MRNAGLDELQAEIKIGGRNINNLRYVDNIILMAESEEEQKSLLMRVKESERAGLRLLKKNRVTADTLSYSFLHLEPISCSIQGSKTVASWPTYGFSGNR